MSSRFLKIPEPPEFPIIMKMLAKSCSPNKSRACWKRLEFWRQIHSHIDSSTTCTPKKKTVIKNMNLQLFIFINPDLDIIIQIIII